MALDGITLHFIKTELEETLVGARIEKVHQPAKCELTLHMRTRSGAYRLLLSAESASPRIHITQRPGENPQNPPMLCMLLRKHLSGAVLVGLRQSGLDRVLFLDFDATNEIGDKVRLSLCVEIMGQHSNIILIDGNGMILDAVKRVDSSKSAYREILPGVAYQLPPQQDKIQLTNDNISNCLIRLFMNPEQQLPAAFMKNIEGISPIVSRELAFRAAGDCTCTVREAGEERIKSALEYLSSCLQKVPAHCVVCDEEEKPFDFSFLEILQYGGFCKKIEYASFCALLDDFYAERDRLLRAKRRAGDLHKTLQTLRERTARKMANRQAQLKDSAEKDRLRIFGELIQANQYALEKGASFYELENYYDGNQPVRIPADPALTPSQNAQKYYKAYKKASTAEKMLAELIAHDEQELSYFASVEDALSRAEAESDLAAIRQELIDGKYLKRKKGGKQRLPKELPPHKFKTSEGFTVLVGRNNVQNDKLTLKTAKNYDMWLHTQHYAGSHTILVSDNREITDQAISEAAAIAAFFSSACDAQKVPVDYTRVKNIKKPAGAKPGKVIYNTYNTIYVTPTEPKEEL